MDKVLGIFKGIVEALPSGTVRRAAAAVLGITLVALNHKLGLDLSDAELAALSAMVLGYLGQSAYKEAAQAKAAAVALPNVGAAIDYLQKQRPEL